MVDSVEVSQLGPLDELDEGAFGTVYRLSSYALPGFADLAYKQFKNAPTSDEIANLTALVWFRAGLDARSRTILDDAAAWPLRLVTSGGTVCGFLMQLIPAEFFGKQLLPSGRMILVPRTSQWLVVDTDRADVAGIDVARADDIPARLVLCAKLAHVFGVLHRAGLVYGDLSLNNVVFSPASPPRVMLVDCDAVQAPGTALTAQAHTDDWRPPECVAGHRPQDAVTDCYKLALFILRALTPSLHASQSVDPMRVVGVLDHTGNTMMGNGLGSDRTARPSAKEWYDYLTRYLAVLTSPPEFTGVDLDTSATMAGSMVTVAWRVAGADRVMVEASDGYTTVCDAATGAGQCRVAVTRTGPFTLTAENRFGTTTVDTRPVFVLEPPTISRIDLPSVVLPQIDLTGRGLADALAGIRFDAPRLPSHGLPSLRSLMGAPASRAWDLPVADAPGQLVALLAGVGDDARAVARHARAASAGEAAALGGGSVT